jgi:hypothetical protein
VVSLHLPLFILKNRFWKIAQRENHGERAGRKQFKTGVKVFTSAEDGLSRRPSGKMRKKIVASELNQHDNGVKLHRPRQSRVARKKFKLL